MKFFKLENDNCSNCPYYRSPPLDFPKQQQYHECKYNFKSSLNLNDLIENCQIQNIENLLKNFMLYLNKNNYDLNDLVNFQLCERVIAKFISEGLK